MSSPSIGHAVGSVGSGPKVLFVHGGVVCGELTWSAQLPLSEKWTLLILDRFGYGPGQHDMADDHEADAEAIVERLTSERLHLVGQSSGAIVAMRAASICPDRVASLVLCEPPFWSVAELHGRVAQLREKLETLFTRVDLNDGQWAGSFAEAVGSLSAAEAPSPRLIQGIRALRRTKNFPWNIEIDLNALKRATFPKLVVTGAHEEAFEVVGNRIAETIGAERAQLPGFKHSLPRGGAAFNTLLDRFLSGAMK